MNTFQRKLINEFKSFVKDESKLELDFRTYVFITNEYGGYPQYTYSDAEIIIRCFFSFLDKHQVDYSGRYNTSMMLDSLKTQSLNDFLLVHLEQEIEKSVFNAILSGFPEDTMTVIGVNQAEYDEDGTTIEVECKDITDKTITFAVQTVDGDYRSDLGCWITTDCSDGDIDLDDYPFFNVSVIIDQAEKYLKESYKLEYLGDHLYLQIDSVTNECELLEENTRFINPDSSNYQRKWNKSHGKFESKRLAIEYIKNL